MSLLSIRKRIFETPAVRAGLTAVSLALLSLAMPAALSGQTVQTGNGSVRGTVTDPDTAIIPGAAITLTPASGKPVARQHPAATAPIASPRPPASTP